MTNIKNQEILEENLSEVSGGVETREKTVTVPVKLPVDGTIETIITVYVDGVLQSNLTRTIDSCIESINLTFKGTSGSKTVDIKLNNNPYISYLINFDTRTYTIL